MVAVFIGLALIFATMWIVRRAYDTTMLPVDPHEVLYPKEQRNPLSAPAQVITEPPPVPPMSAFKKSQE